MFGKMNFTMILLVLGTTAVLGRPNNYESPKEKEAETILENVETEMKDVEAKLALIGQEEVAEKKLLEDKAGSEVKGTQQEKQSLIPITEDLRPKIAKDFVETIDEIKQVEQELIKVEKDLGEFDVDFTKTNTLLKEGEKNVQVEIPKPSEEVKGEPEKDVAAFGRVDDIMTKVSNQMKSVLQCFQVYMQCLKDTKHDSKTCHEKLRSDDSCHTGNVKIH